MKTLRIAVIGAGPRAQAYMTAITKLTDCYTLCAVCDKYEDRRQTVSERYGVNALYASVEKMLVAEKPDVVFCLAPTDSLSVMALTVASHKVNVITEIPIAIARPIADAIVEECKKNGLKYEIAENVWRWPQERLKRKIIEAGLLGDINHARLWYTSGSYHGFNAVRMILAAEAKRVLGYVGEFSVPQYMSYGGEPMNKEMWESAIIEFENGVVCLYESPPKGIRGSLWEFEGTHGYLSGNELALYKNGERYQIQFVNTEIDGEQVLDCVRVDTDPPIIWTNPFKKYKISEMDEIAKASILYSMYRAVTEDIEPEYGAANALRDLELYIAVQESALRGNVWIDIPIKELTELERRIIAEYERRYGQHPIKGVPELLDTTFDRLSVIWSVARWL